MMRTVFLLEQTKGLFTSVLHSTLLGTIIQEQTKGLFTSVLHSTLLGTIIQEQIKGLYTSVLHSTFLGTIIQEQIKGLYLCTTQYSSRYYYTRTDKGIIYTSVYKFLDIYEEY